MLLLLGLTGRPALPEAPLPTRKPTITREEIAQGLRELGVAPGDCLIVHASLSSLGWVAGGAQAVVGALRDAVFPRGTIAVPYLDVPFSDGYAERAIRVTGPGGINFEVCGIKECPGCSANFDVVDEPMTRCGRQVIGTVGEAECRLMVAEDLIRTVHDLLDADLGALLCERAECPVCPRARATLPRAHLP